MPSLLSLWSERQVRREIAITLPLLVIVFVVFFRFIIAMENRHGVQLADPVLAAIEPRDATWPIFALIYGSLALGVVSLLSSPRALLTAMQAYVLLIVVRMCVMYLAPLDPPIGMIPLIDPFAGAGAGTTLTRDLFFSGHTATLFLLLLTARRRQVRITFAITTTVTAALLLVQHIHYALDVASAPFFTYTCYRAALWFERWRLTPSRG